MGFYIRKSIKAGPFRFNLSKSGVGVSTGIPGFRLGLSPRGAYIHAGRGGVYYRKTISSKTPRRTQSKGAELFSSGRTEITGPSDVHMVEIESGDVLQMVDSSAADLLAELNNKKDNLSFQAVLAVICAVSLVLMISQSVGALTLLLFCLVLLATWLGAYLLDQKRNLTVLMYDLNDNCESQFKEFIDGFEVLSGAKKKWHIPARGNVRDPKYHAGAGHLVNRKGINLGLTPPKRIKTNIPVPAIPVGRQTIYFFPERLFVADGQKYGAIPYSDVNISISRTRFIEDDAVPKDSQVVDWTWQYVNKKGGPDRRFKDNKKLPVALYSEILIASDSGLNECLQFSNVEKAEQFKKSLDTYANFASKAYTAIS